MIYENVLQLIGNTPLYKLGNLELDSEVYVKLEKVNPGGSVKDRAVLGMLEGMEERGELNPGDVLVEATSGNTGIALSMIGKTKGYEVLIVMPETMSVERRNLMKAYGAELILTDGKEGMDGAVKKAEDLLVENPNYKSLKQFENEDNPKIHYNTTAKEIYSDLPDVDIVVISVGTGGTLAGIAKYLKEKNPNVKVIAVEPTKSPLISKGEFGPHKIQGIGANFVPKNYDADLVDEIITVDDDDAFDTVRVLAKKEGILVGISSGANIFAAIQVAKNNPGKKIVTVAPDGIDKYMSMGIIE
ncbi:MAG: cysteine synthase A [Clostridioides sp.]|jgi:cysteine synthase A|nr:cysteine synthase A [Clostridioides sp.]